MAFGTINKGNSSDLLLQMLCKVGGLRGYVANIFGLRGLGVESLGVLGLFGCRGFGQGWGCSSLMELRLSCLCRALV